MEKTAVEWLQEQLNKILIDNQIQQTLHLFEQAKQMEEEQSDNLAICFSEWCLSELLNGNEPKAETMQGLLETFKNK